MINGERVDLEQVGGNMDRLGHLSYPELTTERDRLQKLSDGPGVSAGDGARLRAIKGLIVKHNDEARQALHGH